ncbi:MAG: oligosaccharide flippase family protein, partial [Deltaproteobacteria bacterium]|nr:oligosaccharide flippase family protein [Deltaproteobacteria bacterium]
YNHLFNINRFYLFSSNFPCVFKILTKFISELTGSNNSDIAKAVFSKLVKIQFLISLFLTIILIFCFYFKFSYKIYYLVVFLTITPLSIATLFSATMQGLQCFKTVSVIGSLISLLQFFLVITCVFLGKGLNELIAVPLLAGILHTYLLYSYLKKNDFSIKIVQQIPGEYVKKIFKYGAGFYLSLILTMIIWQKSEIFFLKIYSSSEELAFYSLAFNITTYLISIVFIFSAVIFPVFSKYYGEKDTQGIKNIYQKSIKAVTLFYFPLAIIIIAISRPLINLTYSSEYLPVATLLIIMTVSSLFPAIGNISYNLILAVNRVDIQLKYTALAAVLNIVLDFLLIPQYGSLGAALANSSVKIISLPIWVMVTKRELGFQFPTKEIIPCLMANLSLAFFLLLIGNKYPSIFGIFLVVGIALILYPVLLLAFRAITRDDIRIAKEISTVLPVYYEKKIGKILDKIPVRKEIN